MNDTYMLPDGRVLPVPEISENLLLYLDTVAPMSRYKELETDVQLHNMHGQMKIIDHLRSLHDTQNRKEE